PGDRFGRSAGPPLPPLRMRMAGASQNFVFEHARHPQLSYRLEEARGYQSRGELWSHGHFKVLLGRDSPATLIASTEGWETLVALRPSQAQRYEFDRRARLVHIAGVADEDRTAAELVLAADQFLIAPAGRIED